MNISPLSCPETDKWAEVETGFVLFIFYLWIVETSLSHCGVLADCESVCDCSEYQGSGHYYFLLLYIVVVTGDNI